MQEVVINTRGVGLGGGQNSDPLVEGQWPQAGVAQGAGLEAARIDARRGVAGVDHHHKLAGVDAAQPIGQRVPKFRTDAPRARPSFSSTVTDQPASRAVSAWARPTMPAPTMPI